MIVRRQLYTLQERLAEPRRFIQVLAGPRQVGKTTLIRQLVELLKVPVSSETADGVEENDSEWIADRWNAVRMEMRLTGQTEHVLIIDEIHKIARWSEIVKREWDADTRMGVNIKVVLLGSSRLMLREGLKESLAGRFELIRMPHWSYAEMKEAFGVSLEQYIYFGGYPGAAALMDKETRWRNYVRNAIIAPAIDKDVLLTKRILKPALLRQLFELGCGYSGELLSFNKIIGQLQDAGNTSTLANYLNTLDEAHLLCGFQKYARDMARKYQSVPKYQVYNTALMSVYKGNGFAVELKDRRRWGRWVESAIGTHIINYAEEYGYKVYYWRKSEGQEVDFVIERGEELLAIEVKSGRRTDNEGLHLFRDQFHPTQTLVVGSGGIPVETFLLADMEMLFDVKK